MPLRTIWSSGLSRFVCNTRPTKVRSSPCCGAFTRVPSLTIVPTKFVCSARTGGGAHRRRPALTVREAPSVPPPRPHDETVSHTDETHANNVEAVRRGIVDGQVYQVNIGKHWQGEIDHPYHVFQRLMMQNPAPFSAYVHANDLGFALASSSSESLLSLEGDKLQTSPIKGTCPQGDNLHEAAELRQTMMADEKERAEHRMLVDLMRNDLKVAEPAPLRLADLMSKRTPMSSIWSVTSREHFVRAQRCNGQAVFPGGSITAARARLSALRSTSSSKCRGRFGRVHRYIDVHTGRSAWNILIRTLEAHATKGRWPRRAGGGITIASQPENEVEEAGWKGAALRIAAGWMSDERTCWPQGPSAFIQCSHPHPPDIENGCRPIPCRGDENAETGVLFIDNLDSFS